MATELARIGVGDEHDVLVGRGILDEVAHMVPAGAERALVVSSGTVPRVVDRVVSALSQRHIDVLPVTIPDAEAAKTAEVASGLWSRLGDAGFTRTDAVVGVGGGAVTDLAGFVAATWLRGVSVTHVPTTLLAMVDAAVGGKSGINTAEGKNLVGAFHPPAGVVCDLDVLATLPRADYVAGLAEVIKAGFIVDPVILDLVEADPGAAARWDGPATVELVVRAITVKADVVAEDLRESYLREILNYGHTFGHAVEQVEVFRRRHGEAVSIGMVFAAELAGAAGMLARDVVDRHRRVLGMVGLPTAYANGDWPALHAAMARDKKSRGSRLRFVVLEAVARPVRLEDPQPELLEAAFRAVSRPG